MKRANIFAVIIGIIVVVLGMFLGGFFLFVRALSDPGDDGSLPAVIGARMEADHLILAFGEGCPQNATVTVEFDMSHTFDPATRVTMGFETKSSPQTLDLHSLPSDVFVTTPLPDGFDWLSTYSVSVHTEPPNRTASIFIDELADSANHPAGEFYYGDLGGWSTPEDIAARAGAEFVTVCTPD